MERKGIRWGRFGLYIEGEWRGVSISRVCVCS